MIVRIEEVLQHLEAYEPRPMWLLVDRIRTVRDDDNLSRALDSIQTAFQEGGGAVRVIGGGRQRDFSSLYEADGIRFEEPTEALFSYNNPLGACPVCGGFGKIIGIDENLVVPDPSRSIYDDAVACWRGEVMKWFKENVVQNGAKFGFPIHKAYCQLTPEQKELLWKGTPDEEIVGIDRFFQWVESQRYKIQYKYMLAATAAEAGSGRRPSMSAWAALERPAKADATSTN